MSEEKKYRVGVIGVGRQGSHHARTYALNPRCELVAGADTDEENLALFGARFGARGYSSYQEMFACEEIDIAAPVLPVRANAAAVIAAAQAGVKLISCEKPLTAKLADADCMVEACRTRGILFAAGLVTKNRPHFWQALEMIQVGEIGQVHSINTYGDNGQGGCHSINLARHFADFAAVEWVTGWVTGDPFSDYEEAHEEGQTGVGQIGGHIRFANGIDCFCHYKHPWKGVEVIGTKGIIFNDAPSSSELYLWKAKDGAEPKSLGDLEPVEGVFPHMLSPYNPDGSRVRDEEGWILSTDGLIDTVQAMVEALDGKAPLRLTTGEDLQQALEICIAMRQSAQNGQAAVRLPLEDRSLQLFPVKGRWNYKKEVHGEAWYRDAMQQIKI
jgi:predicted dehydrogenase